MSEFIKSDNTSWEVLSDRVAVKSTDLSSLKYNEIRVTNEVKDYFSLENMERHERRDIFLHYGGTAYPCVIYRLYERGKIALQKIQNRFRTLFRLFFDSSEAQSAPVKILSWTI